MKLRKFEPNLVNFLHNFQVIKVALTSYFEARKERF